MKSFKVLVLALLLEMLPVLGFQQQWQLRVRTKMPYATEEDKLQSEVRAPRPMKRRGLKKKPQSSDSGTGAKARLLRIIGGEARGRKLESPETLLRPMMSKVREAMFSSLGSLGVFAPPRRVAVLDIFCGSGAVGCEALSRGADFAAFVDISQNACDTANRNANNCGYDTSRALAVCTSAENALKAGPALFQDRSFDLISLTPPYEEVVYADLLDAVATTSLLKDDAVVAIEYPVELGSLPPTYGDRRQLVGLRNRRYGRTVLALYAFQPTGRLPFQFKLEEFAEQTTTKQKKKKK